MANIHILIVISSPQAGELVRRLFENLGFSNLYFAQEAIEAIQFLRDLQLHLIITDADLRVTSKSAAVHQTEENTLELNGIQFVHRLRSSPSSPAPFIPVLMLMDTVSHGTVYEARDAGVNEIILKPLEARNFCERIIALIDQPRTFITADTYRGPCRRRNEGPPPGMEERRVREIRLVRCNEMKGTRT